MTMAFEKRKNSVVAEAFISEGERIALRAKAIKYRENGVLKPNPGGPFRYARKITDTEYCDELVRSIGERVAASFSVLDCEVDPYIGWVISYIEPGGHVMLHIDNYEHYVETSDKHLRCNVLVQGVDKSVYPVIDDAPVEVHEKGLWAFFASDYAHATQLIKGEQPRIVYQFGFTVPDGYRLPDGSS